MSSLCFPLQPLKLSRRPEASSAGGTPATLKTGSKEKGARTLAHFPSLSFQGQPHLFPNLPRSHPACFCRMTGLSNTSPVPLMLDHMSQAGPPGSSPPHGPNEKTESVCSVLYSQPMPQPQGSTSGLPGERRALPVHQAPLGLQLRLHPASSHGFAPSTPGSESQSPGLARRRGWPWRGSATLLARGRPR